MKSPNLDEWCAATRKAAIDKINANRLKPVHLLHSWDRSRIHATLTRRATVYLRTAFLLFTLSALPCILNAPLWVFPFAGVGMLASMAFTARAWFLGRLANMYEV